MPSAERPVVADATPVIALACLGRLALLRDLYRQVLIPEAVHGELASGGRRPGGSADLSASPWIEMRQLRNPLSVLSIDFFGDLHRGEAQVLALAREIDARLVVMDDRLGRRHAARLGLTVTGTLGVLLAAKQLGYEQRISPLLNQLDAHGIYLSRPLRALAVKAAGEE